MPTAPTKKLTKEELLAKAYKPAQDAMKMHPFYQGKIEVSPKCCVRDFNDFALLAALFHFSDSRRRARRGLCDEGVHIHQSVPPFAQSLSYA